VSSYCPEWRDVRGMPATLDKSRFGPWALITGASSGIGKEFARQLAGSGINVVLIARREKLLAEVAIEISQTYRVEHRVIVADLSVDRFIGELTAATQNIDIGLVISNAGSANSGRFTNKEPQELAMTLRLSALAHAELALHFGPRLIRRGRGGMVLWAQWARKRGRPSWRMMAEQKHTCRASGWPFMRNGNRRGSV